MAYLYRMTTKIGDSEAYPVVGTALETCDMRE